MKQAPSSSIQLLSSKLNVSYQKWGDGPEPILAFHGWLDNSNSFKSLAENLDERFSFYAFDLPGHGHSEHLAPSADYTVASGVQVILDLAKTMGFDSFHLMGHSMGAGLASLVAGVVPCKIRSLTLIEGLGPLSAKKEDLPQNFLKNFKIRFRKLVTEKPSYSSLEDAALDRHRKSGLPMEASRTLAERGLMENKPGAFTWRTDTKLLIPTAQALGEEEIHVFLERISSKTNLILGSTSGMDQHIDFDKRMRKINSLKLTTLEGGHHVHMEKAADLATLLNASL